MPDSPATCKGTCGASSRTGVHQAAGAILKPVLKANVQALARPADGETRLQQQQSAPGLREIHLPGSGQEGCALRQRATAAKAGSGASSPSHVQPSSTDTSLSSPGGEREQRDRAGSWVVVQKKLWRELERLLPSDPGTGRARTSREGRSVSPCLGKADTGCKNQILQHVLSASGLTLGLSLPTAELQMSCMLLERTNLNCQAE